MFIYSILQNTVNNARNFYTLGYLVYRIAVGWTALIANKPVNKENAGEHDIFVCYSDIEK